jgi:phosphonate transport system substrate-binding protein
MVLPLPRADSKRPAVAAVAIRLKLTVFCGALADTLGTTTSHGWRVVPKTFEKYEQLLEDVSLGQLDMAWLPPLMAARASATGVITPLVVPVRGEHAWYATALFSAPGSCVRSLADLQGVRVAWVDPKSMGGHVVMRAWLLAQGVDLGAAFSEEVFLGTHDQVVEAVLDGRADVGVAFAHQDPTGQRILSAAWGDAPVQVIAVAGRIPSDVLAAKTGTDTTLIGAVHDALTGDMNGDLRGAALALFEADRFADADEGAMNSLAELVVHADG